MATLTGKQAKQLLDLKALIDAKRNEYLAAYNAAKATTGVGVPMQPGSAVKARWDELVALRNQRNTLLATFRSLGINI